MEVPMAMGRPKAALVLNMQQREQLEGLASSRSLPAGLVTRARIVLMSAAGSNNQEIARQLRTTKATVGKWRRQTPSSPNYRDFVKVFPGQHTSHIQLKLVAS
jgi:Homeodomain-like domain-containing protein